MTNQSKSKNYKYSKNSNSKGNYKSKGKPYYRRRKHSNEGEINIIDAIGKILQAAKSALALIVSSIFGAILFPYTFITSSVKSAIKNRADRKNHLDTEMNIEFISSGDLSYLVDIAKQSGIAAIDTEFMQTTSYYGILSLVQMFFGGNTAYVIDIRSRNCDKESVYKIMQDESIVKVFHSCTQDCEVMNYFFNKPPKNIQDTQLMAKMLGFGSQVGYSFLVKKYLKIDIDKSSQMSKWLKRPLTSKQIKYAALDVFYLLYIYEKMKEELEQSNMYEIFLSDCEYLSSEESFARDETKIWRKFRERNIYRMSSEGLDTSRAEISIAKSLVFYIHSVAKKRNRLPRIIMSDRDIKTIWIKKPSSVASLEKCVQLTTFISEKDRQKIVDIVNKI